MDAETATITLVSRGRKLEIEFNPDTTIETYVDIFKTILKHETFCFNTIDDVFDEPYKELSHE